VNDEIAEKRYHLEMEDADRARQKQEEIRHIERQLGQLDARDIHQKIIEKPNENKDIGGEYRGSGRYVIPFTRQERTFVAWY
jgi:hypothetical protein